MRAVRELRIVTGRPDPAELAALTVALLMLAGSSGQAGSPGQAGSSGPARPAGPVGAVAVAPSKWRASGRPGGGPWTRTGTRG